MSTAKFYNNGFGNKKSLNEQIEDIKKAKMSRKAKVDALIKLGIRENEIAFVLPVVPHVPSQPRFAFTFGVEIETVGLNKRMFMNLAERNGLSVYDHTDCYAGCHTDIARYKLVPDGSINGENAAECVTPALNGNNDGFNSLKACCESLNAAGAYANVSCGLHVHIGANRLSGEQYVNVFKNYQMLETLINSFMSPSRRHSHWAKSLRNFDFSNCHCVSDVLNVMDNNRYHKVNPCSFERHHTIEFRQHQGTTNYKKIQMWVRFVSKLVAYSMNNVIEVEPTSISEIPFLNAAEKRFFEERKASFEARNTREVA